MSDAQIDTVVDLVIIQRETEEKLNDLILMAKIITGHLKITT